jgi:hypothetical protein
LASMEVPYVERSFSTSLHSIHFLTLGSSSMRRFMASWSVFGLVPFVFAASPCGPRAGSAL